MFLAAMLFSGSAWTRSAPMMPWEIPICVKGRQGSSNRVVQYVGLEPQVGLRFTKHSNPSLLSINP